MYSSEQTAYVKKGFLGKITVWFFTLIEINNLYICFVVTVDIEKAFDLLDHDFLCQVFFLKKKRFWKKAY